MPGSDFVLRAPNVTMDQWLGRPAVYHDFHRALHVLLMVYAGESPDRVVEYTPHGCGHCKVSAGAQLAAQGVITDAALESIGQWEKGSKMPGKYDSASCVTELQTRSVIAETLRTGWRPSADRSLPAHATPALERTMMPRTPTAHIQTVKAILVVPWSSTSVIPGQGEQREQGEHALTYPLVGMQQV